MNDKTKGFRLAVGPTAAAIEQAAALHRLGINGETVKAFEQAQALVGQQTTIGEALKLLPQASALRGTIDSQTLERVMREAEEQNRQAPILPAYNPMEIQRGYERRRIELAAEEERARLRVRDEHEASKAASQPQAAAPEQPPAKETTAERQDRRLQLCINAGLPMNERALRRLPDGVGAIATQEGVTRQTLSEDVRAALKRKLERERPKPRLVPFKK